MEYCKESITNKNTNDALVTQVCVPLGILHSAFGRACARGLPVLLQGRRKPSESSRRIGSVSSLHVSVSSTALHYFGSDRGETRPLLILESHHVLLCCPSQQYWGRQGRGPPHGQVTPLPCGSIHRCLPGLGPH